MAHPPASSAEQEDALIPLSALQHQLFCARQCALIHVEQQWAEDGATAEGRLLHEKVDAARGTTRPGVRIARGIALRSLALGVAGRADVVEFLGRPPQPYPVEYKRGKPKAHRADEVQLCAQAICLEEMLGCAVPEGALFYAQTRRRMTIVFDAALRQLTAETAMAARANILTGVTPRPIVQSGCRACSLQDICQPGALERPSPIADWLAREMSGQG